MRPIPKIICTNRLNALTLKNGKPAHAGVPGLILEPAFAEEQEFFALWDRLKFFGHLFASAHAIDQKMVGRPLKKRVFAERQGDVSVFCSGGAKIVKKRVPPADSDIAA